MGREASARDLNARGGLEALDLTFLPTVGSRGARVRHVPGSTHIIIMRMRKGKENFPRKQKLVSSRQTWNLPDTRAQLR